MKNRKGLAIPLKEQCWINTCTLERDDIGKKKKVKDVTIPLGFGLVILYLSRNSLIQKISQRGNSLAVQIKPVNPKGNQP